MKTPAKKLNLSKIRIQLSPVQAALLGTMVVASSCGTSASSPSTANLDISGTTTQLAASTVGGAVSSTSEDSLATNESRTNSAFAKIMNALSPVTEAYAAAFASCPTIVGGAAGGTCSLSGSSISLGFPTAGCVYGGIIGPIWLGGTTVTVGGTPPDFQCGGLYPVLSSSNPSVTRTYLGNLIANPTSTTSAGGGETVVLDTSAPTATTFGSTLSAAPTAGTIGYAYSIPAGGGYERQYVSNTSQNLSVTIRLAGYFGSSSAGTVAYDHTLSTTAADGTATPLNVTLTGSGSSQVATVNGTLNLQHNLLKMTASSVFNNVAHERTCCYPVSGEIVTSFASGSNAGMSESLQFSAATCELATLGQATFTDVNGNVSTKTLNHCF